MKTGIYVYASTTLDIVTNEDNLKLEPMASGMSSVALDRTNRITVAPGVFRVLSMNGVAVTPEAGGNAQVIALGDKDQWPDPPPLLLTMFSGVTSETLDEFFPMSKGL